MGRVPTLPSVGKLQVVEDPDNERKITVSGYLMHAIFEPKSFFPTPKGGLWHRTIKLKYWTDKSKTEQETELTTDANGFFGVEIEFAEVPEWYSILVQYEGETIVPQSPKAPVEIYFPCQAIYTTRPAEEIEGKPRSLWWVWLTLGLGVAVGGFFLYWYLKRRRKKPTIKIAEGKETPAPLEETKTPKEPEKDNVGGDLLRIEIHFPQIKDPLPAVWGEGEPITVLIWLKDRNGDVLSSQPGEVSWGDGETIQAVSDKEGWFRLEHAFYIKGEYIISVTYTDGSTGKEVSSWRKIRIVDYREEMVRLFNEMVSTLNIKDIHIDRKMTAREIEKLLAQRLGGVPGRTIRKIVAGFEEANYSLHPVAGKSYQAMYLAISEVLRNAG